MAASTNLLLKEVKDITECPICTDKLCDPKTLPCFHTFCLKCIEQYGEDKRPGESMPCPMCRRQFKIPTGGFLKLGTNFFIDRLITAQSGSDSDSSNVTSCDVCTRVGKTYKVEASSFCMICRENLCDECCKIHKSMMMTMRHKLLPVKDVSDSQKQLNEESFCIVHPTEEIKFYCQDCRIPTCMTCSIINHSSHKLKEIGETAREFKKDFLKYSNDTSMFMVNMKEWTGMANEQVEFFKRTIEKLKKDIVARGEEIKQIIDNQTNDLLGKLNSHETSILENIESEKEGLQINLMICDTFDKFCKKVSTDADSIEIVRLANELKTRAEDLKLLQIPEQSTLPQIIFMPSVYDIPKDQDNIVGKLSLKLQQAGYVQGITSSNDELYVVTGQSPDIDVYDIDTLAHRQKIRVEGLVNGNDIVAHANVLYVSENKDKLIHRIQLSDETSSHWSVNGDWLTMSINKEGNVLVSCYDLHKIIEFTPTGSWVREIQVNAIDGTTASLQHAIQLDDDRFVICYTIPSSGSRVGKIDNNGEMITRYGGGEGSGIGQMRFPYYLAIDRNGFILVADMSNNCVMQLNASLDFIREFIPASVGLKQATRMHSHKDTRRLCIAERAEQNITIFDL